MIKDCFFYKAFVISGTNQHNKAYLIKLDLCFLEVHLL